MLRLLSGLLILLFSTIAQAEGVTSGTSKIWSPYTPPAQNADIWSGNYVGLYIPWAIDSDDTSFGAGGTVGIRRQFSSGLVLGAEADLAKLWENNQVLSYQGEVFGNAELSWLGSARGFAGYAVGNVLPYISAGWAIAGWEVSWGEGTQTGIVDGFVWGAGVETKLTKEISLKVDWSRYDFGAPNELPCLDFSQDIVALKLNYKF